MGTCNDPYARILRAAGAAIEVIAVATSARIMSSMETAGVHCRAGPRAR